MDELFAPPGGSLGWQFSESMNASYRAFINGATAKAIQTIINRDFDTKNGSATLIGVDKDTALESQSVTLSLPATLVESGVFADVTRATKTQIHQEIAANVHAATTMFRG